MSNGEKGQITFDEEVLNYVKHSRKIDDSILNNHLIKSKDKFGSLLHYAALERNTAVVQQLITLGSEVDSVGRNGYTPFMYAVNMRCRAAFAKIFLKAKASIDIVDDEGRSVLQMALGDFKCDSPLVKLFASKVKTKRTTSDTLAKRLIAAGCKMYEAATLKDVAVMQCMLKQGIDINSKSPTAQRTALHRAAEMDDVDIANWLIDIGADVNAQDEHGSSPAHLAATLRHKAVLKVLLEQGADPNRKDNLSVYSSLVVVCLNSGEMEDHVDADECVKLLLQHGALVDNFLIRAISYRLSYYDFRVCSDECDKMLIAQLAILEMLGTSNYKKGMFSKTVRNRSERPEFEVFRQLCLQVLPTKLVEEFSLFDLLNASDSRLNSLVRRKTFASNVKRACSKLKLSETHYFYYDTLMMRIDKAVRVVKLEEKAILVICKLFRCSYNQCHNFAREIVSYLKEYKLEQLIQV